MKNAWIFVCLFSAFGFAQAPPSQSANHRSNSQIVTFVLKLQESRVLGVAEVMPEEKYSFAPTSGAFKGVRSFAEQLKHIAADNYMLGAGILGEQVPVDVGRDESGARDLQTKEEVIAYVKKSFAYMRKAADAIDDTNTTIPTPDISPWPEGTATRMGLALEDCVHTWDHYGQLVEYLRMNNIVPPGSK